MKRTVVTTLVLALIPSLAQAQSSRSLGFVAEDLPAPPQLEYSSTWLAEEYSRQFESHASILRSQPLDLGNWESLTTLQKETKIRVVDANFKKTKGRFIAADEQRLRFKANGKIVILDRDDVRMVSLRFGPSTGERILMGLLEGAMIGAITYAEARTAETRDCWYEDSGKGPSARTGYLMMGVGAAGLGILAAFAETEDAVIYFQEEPIATIDVPTQFELAPSEPGGLEGGNVFAPVTHEPEEGSREVEE